MLTLNDGRSELWQWDTGRKLTVDADCSQVHFSNKVFGRSIDVDVVGGVAIIPDVLLQIDNDLTAWAFVGTPENGYTKISKVFKVNKRNKPADYVFTPTEQTTLGELIERLDKIEESQDPDAIKNAVEDYLEQNPVDVPVESVNGKTGAVKLTAKDVGAISQDDLQEATNEVLAQAKESGEFDGPAGPAGPKGDTGETGPAGPAGKDGQNGKSAYQYAKDGGYTGTEEEFSEKLAKEYPTKVSELANDAGYLTGYTETDPTVPSWAKAATKPSYSKSEVGLGNVDNVKQYSSNNPPPYPVAKVNGKTGDVELDAEDVGARASTWMPTHSDVGADKSGTAAYAVSTHNTKTDAHNDIRLLITALTNRLDALANSDDDTLDQMAEVVAYIKSNRNLIEQITTGKVSVSDIVNNLTTNVTNKPLSAAQGVALKALIDAITIPTKLSQLTNDKGYITGYTETDPTVPAWAKAETKPSYTKSEVGLGNVDNAKQYSASNPPPYPVTSVNGNTGAVTLDAADVGARPSTWTPTAANVGAVPTSRKVNGKALSSDITLAASDVGAVPTSSTITVTGVDADGATHTWTMYGVKN